MLGSHWEEACNNGRALLCCVPSSSLRWEHKPAARSLYWLSSSQQFGQRPILQTTLVFSDTHTTFLPGFAHTFALKHPELASRHLYSHLVSRLVFLVLCPEPHQETTEPSTYHSNHYYLSSSSILQKKKKSPSFHAMAIIAIIVRLD